MAAHPHADGYEHIPLRDDHNALKCPYGHVVRAGDVATVLGGGTFASIPPGLPRPVAFALFSECAPATILSAALEAGGSWQTAQALYKEVVAGGGARVRAWGGSA